jgi:hypothetical protein
MLKPSEIILELHRALNVTIEQFDTVERVELAHTLLDATQQECDAILARLQDTKAKIAETEAARETQFHLIINSEVAERLRGVDREIAEKRAELARLQYLSADRQKN